MNNKEINKIIGLNLQNERKKVNMSQKEVANLIGITRETFVSYEKGRKISALLVAQLSEIYQCPIANFYLGIDVTECLKK